MAIPNSRDYNRSLSNDLKLATIVGLLRNGSTLEEKQKQNDQTILEMITFHLHHIIIVDFSDDQNTFLVRPTDFYS